MTLLEIESLTMQLPGGRRLLENVDLRVESGRTVGLVGESGSGKSLTARAVLGLLGRDTVSYTHLTLPTTSRRCRSRWSPYH